MDRKEAHWPFNSSWEATAIQDKEIEGNSYLVFHDSLFKSWSHHGLLSVLLATTPNVWPIRSLQLSLLLPFLWTLYQRLVPSALGWCVPGIGFGDIGYRGSFPWFVGRDFFNRAIAVASNNKASRYVNASKAQRWDHGDIRESEDVALLGLEMVIVESRLKNTLTGINAKIILSV